MGMTPAELCQTLANGTLDEFILDALRYIVPAGGCMRRDEAFSKLVELAKACGADVNVSSFKTRFSAVLNRYGEVFPADFWEVCRVGPENVRLYFFSVVSELRRFRWLYENKSSELCRNLELFNRAFELSSNCFSVMLRYFGEHRFELFCSLGPGAVAARPEDVVEYVKRQVLPGVLHHRDKKKRAESLANYIYAVSGYKRAEPPPYTAVGFLRLVIDDAVRNDVVVDGIYEAFREAVGDDKEATYLTMMFLDTFVVKKSDYYRELCATRQGNTDGGKKRISTQREAEL